MFLKYALIILSLYLESIFFLVSILDLGCEEAQMVKCKLKLGVQAQGPDLSP